MKENTNVKTTKPIGLRNNVLVQELDKELLLYDLTRDKVFCLNETSLMVWNLCNGENSLEDIRRKVSSQLKTNITEEMIWLALDKLKNEKLLSNYHDIEIDFNGLSRRQLIRKIGLASMTALPIVSSVVAPPALAAQSGGVACGGVCLSSAQCSFSCPSCLMTPQCSNSGIFCTMSVDCPQQGTCSGSGICDNAPATSCSSSAQCPGGTCIGQTCSIPGGVCISLTQCISNGICNPSLQSRCF